jgi:hypothetical protein
LLSPASAHTDDEAIAFLATCVKETRTKTYQVRLVWWKIAILFIERVLASKRFSRWPKITSEIAVLPETTELLRKAIHLHDEFVDAIAAILGSMLVGVGAVLQYGVLV